MKTYIAIEDVNKPQAKTVTESDILNDFLSELESHLGGESFHIDEMRQFIAEMEQGEVK